MDFANLIQTVTVWALPVVFAITMHEAAHGYVAKRLGDNTAFMLGRVTLNPIPHIDPIGTILMPLLLYFATSGGFLFGYARPVPVRFERLRHPKRDMVWVALAGPGSNLFQAFIWALVSVGLVMASVQEPFWFQMCRAGVLVNLAMFAFNLFPLPPLDGGRIAVGLLPRGAAIALAGVERYGFFIVLALVMTGLIGNYWMLPLMDLGQMLIATLLSPLQMLLH